MSLRGPHITLTPLLHSRVRFASSMHGFGRGLLGCSFVTQCHFLHFDYPVCMAGLSSGSIPGSGNIMQGGGFLPCLQWCAYVTMVGL